MQPVVAKIAKSLLKVAKGQLNAKHDVQLKVTSPPKINKGVIRSNKKLLKVKAAKAWVEATSNEKVAKDKKQ